MASRKRKYASIKKIEEAHQSPDEEESAGDRKRKKNRPRNAVYCFRKRSAQVDENERVGENVQVRGSNGPPSSLIEQLLSSEVAPPAETAPVRVREARHDPSAYNVVQQAIADSEDLQRQRRERQAEQARRRRAAMSASQQERTRIPSGNVPVELNNRSVSAIALVNKCAGQVKHRKNAIECESRIVLGANNNLKRKAKRNGKRGKSTIAFIRCRTAPGCHRKNMKSDHDKIAFVAKKFEP
ncbi:hypothetical protein JG687_00019227 [Phytophthora cactorum]|uniref:Uncharacterized protein n=1 Tax=Phytophthora cactorum TaxID=29920 RepID=A0A329RBS2_9STRA|nr:hypothetical protein PC111_g4386 [Phytophthora cactorum]KAG2847507.1 hypothetical protein PC112_g1025 [Phytophthora cactorum]KAG2868193.1 hypothetical protein PC113_g1310 [Phytophthora cactorum]KAG2934054.1 hypothetical protein PC114_g1132 [Phytophthora cactorum]KAG2954824.1 hypothetical protein PC117_g913 [Phytophthora cactorum]